MSNEITRQTNINSQLLDPIHFTQSLLNEAMRAGILYGEDVERIQLNLLNLLAKRVLAYTNGQSSSVQEEVAQSLFESVFYCIDTLLLSLPIPDAADFLRTTDAEKLFTKGNELVKANVAEAAALLHQVSDNRLKVAVLAYNGTIDTAIPDFFASYDVRFAPQDTTALIDYPLSEDDMHVCGIRYILNYLKTLSLENEICQHISTHEINRLLERHGAIYQYDYRDMLVNIFELTLTNAICAVLLGKSAQTLCVSRDDCENLAGKVGSAAVLSAADHVCRELKLPKMQCDYVKRCAKRLVPGYLLAVQQGTLEQLTAAY